MTWPRRVVAANLVLLLLTHGTPARAQEAPAPPVDYVAVQTYMRSLGPEALIRIAWSGTGQADRAVAIARRESHLDCAADNRSSSAAGLFQTMGIHKARAQRLGLSWADVAGPDCLADVLLAYDMWTDSGWAPWAL